MSQRASEPGGLQPSARLHRSQGLRLSALKHQVRPVRIPRIRTTNPGSRPFIWGVSPLLQIGPWLGPTPNVPILCGMGVGNWMDTVGRFLPWPCSRHCAQDVSTARASHHACPVSVTRAGDSLRIPQMDCPAARTRTLSARELGVHWLCERQLCTGRARGEGATTYRARF